MSEIDEVGVRLTIYERAKFNRDLKDSEKDLNDLDTSVHRLQLSAKDMGKEWDNAHGPMLRFTRDSRGAFADLRRDAQGFAGAMGTVFSGVQRAATSNVVQYGLGGTAVAFTAAAGAATYFGLTTVNAIEGADVAFTKFLGSSEKSKAYIAQLKEFAKSTPFEFTNVVPSAQRLLNTGDTTEESLRHLRAIGDAAAGADPIEGQQGFDRIALAMTQIKQSPRANAQDFNQLIQANIDPYGMIGRATGKSSGQVREDVQGGKVSGAAASQILMRGFEQQYGGLMKEKSGTLGGQLSNLKDTTAFAFADATMPVAKLLEANMPQIQKFVEATARQFGHLVEDTIRWGTALVGAYRSGGLDGMVHKLGELVGHSKGVDELWSHLKEDGADVWHIFLSLVPTMKAVGTDAVILVRAAEPFLHFIGDHPRLFTDLFEVFLVGAATWKLTSFFASLTTGIGGVILKMTEAIAKERELAAATAALDASAGGGAIGAEAAGGVAGGAAAKKGGWKGLLKKGAKAVGWAAAPVLGWMAGSELYDQFGPEGNKITQDGSHYTETMTGIQRTPGMATGGTVTGEGMVRVGENGPELLRLGPPAQVEPLDVAGGSSRPTTTVIFQEGAIQIPAADFLDGRALASVVVSEIETRIAHQ